MRRPDGVATGSRSARRLVVGGALVALASWQAASIRVGLIVCAGFIGLTLVLQGVGWLLTRMTRPLARSSWFPMRQAVLHLSRPGNQTRVILLTVGLGTFFIMGVRGLQVNLLNQFALQIGDNTPDMFLVDIQQDQAADMKSVSGRAAAAGIPADADSRAARACHGQGRQPRRGGRPAGPRACCRANTRSPIAASSSRTRR